MRPTSLDPALPTSTLTSTTTSTSTSPSTTTAVRPPEMHAESRDTYEPPRGHAEHARNPIEPRRPNPPSRARTPPTRDRSPAPPCDLLLASGLAAQPARPAPAPPTSLEAGPAGIEPLAHFRQHALAAMRANRDNDLWDLLQTVLVEHPHITRDLWTSARVGSFDFDGCLEVAESPPGSPRLPWPETTILTKLLPCLHSRCATPDGRYQILRVLRQLGRAECPLDATELRPILNALWDHCADAPLQRDALLRILGECGLARCTVQHQLDHIAFERDDASALRRQALHALGASYQLDHFYTMIGVGDLTTLERTLGSPQVVDADLDLDALACSTIEHDDATALHLVLRFAATRGAVFSVETLFATAAIHGAANALRVLQNAYPAVPTDELLPFAVEGFDVPLVRVLCGDDAERITRALFAPQLESMDSGAPEATVAQAIGRAMSQCYRYGSMAHVDAVAQTLAALAPGPYSQSVSDACSASRTRFLQWGSQLARYSARHERAISKLYGGDLTDIDREVAFGMERYHAAERTATGMRDRTLVAAEGSPFQALPPSSTGTSELRAILEHVVESHQAQARARGDSGLRPYGRLRTQPATTPVRARYRWAVPHIERTLRHPDAGVLPRDFGFELSYTVRAGTPHMVTLGALYRANRHGFCGIGRGSPPGSWAWLHGQCNIVNWWPRLEDLHERVKAVAVDPNNAASVRDFFQLLAETLWLIGQTTPTDRGTGTFVEHYLAAMCLFKGLPCPILKLENPQLDCLHLSLSVEAYKRDFFTYFEPESLPECVRPPSAE